MTTITTLEQIQALPPDSVLLCKLREVFQLKEDHNGGRTWFALGYPNAWTAHAVLEWAPLELLWSPPITPDEAESDLGVEEAREVLDHFLNLGVELAAPLAAARALAEAGVGVELTISSMVIHLEDEIIAERQRQISELGFTREYDQGRGLELRLASTSYRDFAHALLLDPSCFNAHLEAPAGWPWDAELWHPSVSIERNLVRAAALQRAANDADRAGEWKFLTVKNPFAAAIFVAGKRVENRGYNTHYRGSLAIHVSKVDAAGRKTERPWQLVAGNQHHHLREHIIGVVDLVSVHSLDECTMTGPCAVDEHGFSWAEFIRTNKIYHWIIENPRELNRPIRHRGEQGLRDIPPAVEHAVYLDQLVKTPTNR